MRAALARLLREAALAHPTRGVNAQIGAIAREAGDAEPPRVATFADFTNNEDVANGKELSCLDDGAALVTTLATVDLQAIGSDRVLPLARGFAFSVFYVLKDAPGIEGQLAADYACDAVVAAIEALAEASQEERTRNGMMLASVSNLSVRPFGAAVGRSTIVAAVVGTCQVLRRS